MDAWALLLKHAFSIPLANYCLVGRWLGHMPEGTFVHAKSPAVIDGAFETIVQKRAGAVLVASDPMFLGQRDRLAALAAKYTLPIVAWTREFASAGLLLSYGTSIAWMYREAGVYAGRILKGSKPSELPIVQPTNFQLVVNLKTAKMLGITVPQSLLLRADEVIE